MTLRWLAVLILLGGCTPEPAPESEPVHFGDAAADAGLDFAHYNAFAGEYFYVETFGAGAAFLDYDSDYDLDLYLVNGSYLTGLPPDPLPVNRLYRNDNRGRSFTDATARGGAADPGYGFGVAAADYDADGDPDLYVANYGANALYRNDGGIFSAVDAGVADPRWSTSTGFLDYDRDGDTDIYVANDGTMNFLYENQGGTFAEIGLVAGTRYDEHGHAEAGMGVDFGDYDRDGDMDLYVTNFAFETNTLYHNDGQGEFDIASGRLGLGDISFRPLGFGTKFLDYDNDRDLDIFVANGHVMDVVAEWDSTQTYRQTNQLFRSENGEHFSDISRELGPAFAAANVGRGTAVADYDDDGDLDLLVTTVADRVRLLRNDGGNRNHWLQILLVGKAHPDALGARVVVTAGGVRQAQERQSGGSYLASHDPRLHFGLGDATRAKVEITWPGGAMLTLDDIAANQVLRVAEQ